MSQNKRGSSSRNNDARDTSEFYNILADLPANPTPDRTHDRHREPAGLETPGASALRSSFSVPTPSPARQPQPFFRPQAGQAAGPSSTSSATNADALLSNLRQAVDRVGEHGRVSMLERDQRQYQQLEEEERSRYKAGELTRTNIHPSKRTGEDVRKDPPQESVVRSREDAYHKRVHADVQLMNALVAKWRGVPSGDIDDTVRSEVERDLDRVTRLMEPYSSSDGPVLGVRSSVRSADNARLQAIRIDVRNIRSSFWPEANVPSAGPDFETTEEAVSRRRGSFLSGLTGRLSIRGSRSGSLSGTQGTQSSQPSSPVRRIASAIRGITRIGSRRRSRANSTDGQDNRPTDEPAAVAGDDPPNNPPPAPRPGFAELHNPQKPPDIPK